MKVIRSRGEASACGVTVMRATSFFSS